MTYKIGILGLGVMGRSLGLNLHRNGIPVVGFDPAPKVDADYPVPVSASVRDLASALETPRVVLLMVPAGEAVDVAIESLKPYLQKGDIIIDGGNSFFADTERRVKRLEVDGISFVGMGVSGGESGALWGPSLMPGGGQAAWARIRPIVLSIAAKAPDGEPCAAWMGGGGAGHYVKMVHNGIEYADMQLIAEMYDLLHRGAGFTNAELAEIFAGWNTGELQSYLIEITARILLRKEGGADLVDLIVDEAAQKGTGKWTSQNAFDVGAPIPTINAAVESRILSSLKAERVAAAQVLGGPGRFEGDRARLVDLAEQALYASKVTSYAQGFAMLRLASVEYGWGLDFASIARVWRAGCIIRAELLESVSVAFTHQPALPNLLTDSAFSAALLARQAAWREVVQTAVGLGIPMLATSASLAYFDAYRSAVLPANLTQAQRDYFGAHTYRRVDRQGSFHTQWDE
ncbi:MAG: NADP-dependent phosphogluconate dehydrogenase [Anaerolineales bacterium]